MKEITSKKTGKIQIITNDTWDSIVRRGWSNRFITKDLSARPLKDIPSVIKKPNKKKNG